MHNFRKLKIWKDSMELVSENYKITRSFPDHERFGLVNQMNRSAVSIPSNIAEGTSKSSNKQFSQYLKTSLGSAFEWETQLIIASNENYIDKNRFEELENHIVKIQKMITNFMKNLEQS